MRRIVHYQLDIDGLSLCGIKVPTIMAPVNCKNCLRILHKRQKCDCCSYCLAKKAKALADLILSMVKP